MGSSCLDSGAKPQSTRVKIVAVNRDITAVRHGTPRCVTVHRGASRYTAVQPRYHGSPRYGLSSSHLLGVRHNHGNVPRRRAVTDRGPGKLYRGSLARFSTAVYFTL